MMLRQYLLNEANKPVLAKDVLEWAQWFETADRIVQQTNVDGWWVSTVFLGIDHQFGNGPPLLFETMIFNHDGKADTPWREHYCERYTTYLQAHEGHWKAVGHLREALGLPAEEEQDVGPGRDRREREQGAGPEEVRPEEREPPNGGD